MSNFEKISQLINTRNDIVFNLNLLQVRIGNFFTTFYIFDLVQLFFYKTLDVIQLQAHQRICFEKYLLFNSPNV